MSEGPARASWHLACPRLATNAFATRLEKHVQVTASLGIACSTALDGNSLTMSTLVTAAEDALYQAKAEGRTQRPNWCQVSLHRSTQRTAAPRTLRRLGAPKDRGRRRRP